MATEFIKTEELKQEVDEKNFNSLQFMDYNFSDNADSISFSSLGIIYKNSIPPEYLVRKLMEDEISIPFLAQMGGYANMNGNAPFSNNQSLKEIIPLKSLTKYSLEEPNYSNYFNKKPKHVNFGIILEANIKENKIYYQKITNEEFFNIVNGIIENKESYLKEKEEKAKINKLKKDLKGLSKEEMKKLLIELM